MFAHFLNRFVQIINKKEMVNKIDTFAGSSTDVVCKLVVRLITDTLSIKLPIVCIYGDIEDNDKLVTIESAAKLPE